jgi:integrase
MPSIQKQGDKWRAHVYVNGRRKTAVWDTKRLAESWANKTVEQLRSLRGSKGELQTFGDAVERYILEVVPNKRGALWEKRRLANMLEYFGDKVRLQDLDSPDMAGWRDWRLNGDATHKPVSPSTVVREVNILKHLLHTARDEWRWIEHDPFRGVRIPSENPARSARWGWQLIKRVLRAGERTGGKTGEVTLAFHIALRTGMRLQEVLASPSNFNSKTRVVTVRTKTAPKGDEIPVGRIAAKLITNAKFTVNPNEASTLFAKLTRKNLIDGLTFHDARATALTLLSKKVDVMDLAKISRHKDISLLHRVYYRTSAADIAAMI